MNIQTVNIHFHGDRPEPSALGALLAFGIFDEGDPPVPGETSVPAAGLLVPPQIGQPWPGQGGIYVGIHRGHDGGPTRHLIRATAPEAIFQDREIGTYGEDVTGATSDHDGLGNTNALADAGSALCKEIRALKIDGHEDFYLMARSEARLCMANVPELFEPAWYHTSTQSSAHDAWDQYFLLGSQTTDGKSWKARAVAVRSISLTL